MILNIVHHKLSFKHHIQFSPFIMLCLVYIQMDCVIGESYYKETMLQRNYWKITIHGNFPIIPLYNFMIKILGATTRPCYIQIHVKMRCVIKEMYCIIKDIILKLYTVKPVLSGHSKIDKTKILMTNMVS